MTFKIKNLTIKNFLSIGNATQAIDLDRQDLTLVLGENLDLGGDNQIGRNGTGKSSIVAAISYALFGQALTSIRKDNLINITNNKNMMVTLDFEVGSTSYRIERGRRPNILKLYINGQEQEEAEDQSQGDSRETQAFIERTLGMSHDMFKHIVALNTYTEPFLSMRANDQRMIIEQLLGITLLSEKADLLRAQIKNTNKEISTEEIKIKATEDANKRIEEQIQSLRSRQRLWSRKHDEDMLSLERALRDLVDIDIEEEIQSHKDLSVYHDKVQKRNECERWIRNFSTDFAKEEKLFLKLSKEIQDLKDHKCYACGGDLHDDNQATILASKQKQLEDCQLHMAKLEEKINDYKTQLEAVGNVGVAPKVIYDSLEEALNHRATVDKLVEQLETKHHETDPYVDQIHDMETKAIQQVSWDKINELTKFLEHQEFLLKLLTNKDSFVRKRIIDQNLSYLNSRLDMYLSAIGLPHTVKFQNDLSVEIAELGRELDFHNLSRGEMNRVVLSLSWAFRDVYESLYNPINLLFIDELMDSGMDAAGVENSLTILKKMTRERKKSIFLISHKDELMGRVGNVLKVIKSNGFTEINPE